MNTDIFQLEGVEERTDTHTPLLNEITALQRQAGFGDFSF